MRFLRGTFIDPFGHTDERKSERALIIQYRETLTNLLPQLSEDNLSTMIALASVPEDIRGYGHVKERHLRNAQEKQAELLKKFTPITTGVREVGRHAA
jgi:indolepyruvate ferredoxin oxidoreductase